MLLRCIKSRGTRPRGYTGVSIDRAVGGLPALLGLAEGHCAFDVCLLAFLSRNSAAVNCSKALPAHKRTSVICSRGQAGTPASADEGVTSKSGLVVVVAIKVVHL